MPPTDAFLQQEIARLHREIIESMTRMGESRIVVIPGKKPKKNKPKKVIV
jgi:hypothetical protein